MRNLHVRVGSIVLFWLCATGTSQSSDISAHIGGTRYSSNELYQLVTNRAASAHIPFDFSAPAQIKVTTNLNATAVASVWSMSERGEYFFGEVQKNGTIDFRVLTLPDLAALRVVAARFTTNTAALVWLSPSGRYEVQTTGPAREDIQVLCFQRSHGSWRLSNRERWSLIPIQNENAEDWDANHLIHTNRARNRGSQGEP
jgi:hypothetical protein